MKKLLDSRQAKELDRYSIQEFGMESLILMERAALAAAGEIKKLPGSGRRVFFMAGTGNNGADGLAAARILTQSGWYAEIWVVGDRSRATKEWSYQEKLVNKLGIQIRQWQDGSRIPDGFDVYVDALFGIGLSRAPGGAFLDAIQSFNETAGRNTQSRSVAIDISSGVRADDGFVFNTAVKADVTVTFGYEKAGHRLYPGADFGGTVKTYEIGFAPLQDAKPGPVLYALDEADAGRMLGARRPDGNKGTFGQVLVIAGADGMAGAACFAAEAAYRVGAGLVKVYTAKQNRPVLQQRLPEAVLLNSVAELEEAEHHAKAIVIGPGLSKSSRAAEILNRILAGHGQVPVVIDADGLNLLAEEAPKDLGKRVILTPHPGELARLLNNTIADLKDEGLRSAASRLQNGFGTVCVCKDARTVIRTSNGQEYLNLTGNCGMAVGGSGDVLAGMIGGLLAQGMEPDRAAVLGTWLHGAAGDAAAEAVGMYGMTASDLLAGIAPVMKRISRRISDIAAADRNEMQKEKGELL